MNLTRFQDELPTVLGATAITTIVSRVLIDGRSWTWIVVAACGVVAGHVGAWLTRTDQIAVLTPAESPNQLGATTTPLPPPSQTPPEIKLVTPLPRVKKLAAADRKLIPCPSRRSESRPIKTRIRLQSPRTVVVPQSAMGLRAHMRPTFGRLCWPAHM
jgi:hypothetical protein